MITNLLSRHRNAMRLRHTRGLTMIEMVVAITIVLVIMAGVVTVFIELLRSHDEARARMDATANARAAMDVLSTEIKRASNTTGTLAFVATTSSAAGGGDRVNQDLDANTDEETLNGADDDGDFAVATSDLHALIPAGAVNYRERPVFYQKPDLDDRGIDEDIGATSTTLEFDTFNSPGEPLNRRVRFYVGTDPDGQPNTLMREVSGIDPATSAPVVASGPICYNVVQFGALYWNHANAKTSTANPWEMNWPPATPPLTASPSTVYLTISVYAGSPLSLQEFPSTKEIPTISLTTVVNVEAVLADPTYVAQRTPVWPVGVTGVPGPIGPPGPPVP